MPGHRRPNVRARRHASAALFCRSPPTATYFWGIFVRRSACTGVLQARACLRSSSSFSGYTTIRLSSVDSVIAFHNPYWVKINSACTVYKWMSMFVGCSKETWWKNAHRHREGCNVRSVRIYPVVCFRSGLLDWTSDDEQQILVQLGHRNARLECQAKLGTQHSISTVTESSRSWVCRTPQF